MTASLAEQTGCYFFHTNHYKIMQVAVWDTYVTKKDGAVMHFDIIAPDHIRDKKTIHAFGKEYLLSKNQENQLRICRLNQEPLLLQQRFVRLTRWKHKKDD